MARFIRGVLLLAAKLISFPICYGFAGNGDASFV